MLKKEHLNFLLELLQTKGLAFPLDKTRIAADTLDALNAEMEKATRPKSPDENTE